MKNTMTYKGDGGTVEDSEEDNCLFRRIAEMKKKVKEQ